MGIKQKLPPLPEADVYGYKDSYSEELLLEYAKNAIDFHRTTKNHIPDARKMITPLAQRKIQSLLDKGEYRVIENATVLVNENGHAAIVNKGGAFYWVDNEALAREFDGVGVGVDSHHIADMRKKVPVGYALVPVEPTDEIRLAMSHFHENKSALNWYDAMGDEYKAMLAAAPKCTGDK